MRKDPYIKERRAFKRLSLTLDQQASKIREQSTPDLEAIKQAVLALIPTPEDGEDGAPGRDGQDASVDYDAIYEAVREEVTRQVAALPKPSDGRDGKDAEVDIDALVLLVLARIPKVEAKSVDYLGIKSYIDGQIKKIRLDTKVVQSFTGGGATHLSQLMDVDLAGLSKNANGQYILNQPGGSATPTFETVSKNLDATNATLNYTGDNLTSIVYANGITKTLNYTGENLTSVVLSGSTPGGIDLTKTLSYTGDNLTGVAYS
jgi:hypothetical protein